ncbi:S8 family serine peptidase [Vibrio cidicii]|uniref:S8 family peptidase n=1 Tax=Vibrio cidicii TaxID=1763883 RepID=UPI0037533681
MHKKEAYLRLNLTKLTLVLYGIIVAFFSPIAHAHEIEFVNFGNKIKLQQSDPEQASVYRLANSDQRVELSNRLIVKVRLGMRDDVINALKRKVKVEQLVVLGPFAEHEFLVVSLEEQAAENLAHALEVANGLAGVAYAQPDLLQVKSKLELDIQNPDQQVSNILLESRVARGFPYRLFRLDTWQKELQQITRGKGVTIVVIDDGFDLEHDAFSQTKLLLTYDIERRVKDVAPQSPMDRHGTKVLGVIGARMSLLDQAEMTGLATDAGFITVRQTKSWTSHTLESLHIAKLANADVINMSWRTQLLLEPIKDAIDGLAQTGRDGKGTMVVLAAGNSGSMIKENSTEASIKSAVVIGALGKDGMPASYSNFGQSVSAWMPGYSAKVPAKNNAYSSFGGTSYAAAYGTGMIALLLASEPELSVDEVKQKLAQVTDVAQGNRQLR